MASALHSFLDVHFPLYSCIPWTLHIYEGDDYYIYEALSTAVAFIHGCVKKFAIVRACPRFDP